MKLLNTLTRTKEELRPLKNDTITMYTCGLTVYSQPHIGNWVGYIYWDVLQRVLEQKYTVIRTQNYTDVGHLTSDDDNGEDKMEKGARRDGITAWDVAEKYIAIAEHEAYDILKLKKPTHTIRATSLIDQQIDFVKDLESKGFTYTIDNDGVYFDTSKLPDYGKLARLDIDGLQAGSRVPVEGKMNITDFALWKFSHAGQKRDMEWDSPWGIGFPGWHLECSVIARETLGDQIDIHTGGIDHIPVHHSNEIAQTESVTGKQFSQIWVHNNHIKVNGTKMAKSLGNIYTLQDILDKGFDIMAFKLMILSKHYQTEGNFTWDILESSQNRLKTWKKISVLRWQNPISDQVYVKESFGQTTKAVKAALEDDLNTPEAIAQIGKALDSAISSVNSDNHVDFDELLNNVDSLLGLDLAVSTPDISDEQKQLIKSTVDARLVKDYGTADNNKISLLDQGIGLDFHKDGSATWYFA